MSESDFKKHLVEKHAWVEQFFYCCRWSKCVGVRGSASLCVCNKKPFGAATYKVRVVCLRTSGLHKNSF